MAGFNSDQDRKVIPRWRTFRKTLNSKELDPVIRKNRSEQITCDFLGPKIAEWKENRDLGYAADVVGTAVTLGRGEEVVDAARFLLRRGLDLSPWLRQLAERVLGTPKRTENILNSEALDKQSLYEQIRLLRRILREEARDPISWVELSRFYAILGLGDQAGRSMTVALELARDNRFVVRAASRLWVHLGDYDRAHDIVVRADRTRSDPWLLAAEIAIGSIDGRFPRYFKQARRLLAGELFSPMHISELASALATLELSSGRIGRSRKLFRTSLKQPTENSIAQAAWVARNHNVINVTDDYLAQPNTFEARSWSFFEDSRWVDVVVQCHLWQRDQPFSAWPCMLGSYVAAVALEDYSTAEGFCEEGLRANPKNFILLNNLAFSLINRSELEEAQTVISKIPRQGLSRRDRAVLYATNGLLEFRFGNVEAGRKLYTSAFVMARRLGEYRLLSLAKGFYALEEMSRNVIVSQALYDETSRLLRREKDPIARLLEDRLTRAAQTGNGMTRPGNADKTRSEL